MYESIPFEFKVFKKDKIYVDSVSWIQLTLNLFLHYTSKTLVLGTQSVTSSCSDIDASLGQDHSSRGLDNQTVYTWLGLFGQGCISASY